MMSAYLYQPVEGAIVFWPSGPRSIVKAKRAVVGLRARGHSQAEVERVLLVGNHGRRYWRWRNGSWSTEKHYDPLPADLQRW
jgi:hypothetical protein